MKPYSGVRHGRSGTDSPEQGAGLLSLLNTFTDGSGVKASKVGPCRSVHRHDQEGPDPVCPGVAPNRALGLPALALQPPKGAMHCEREDGVDLVREAQLPLGGPTQQRRPRPAWEGAVPVEREGHVDAAGVQGRRKPDEAPS
jgi:hypothetical protein